MSQANPDRIARDSAPAGSYIDIFRNTRPAQNGGPDIMSSIFNTAANWMGQGEGGGGWQNIVQDYVKQAMDSAAAPRTEEDTKRKRKSKGW